MNSFFNCIRHLGFRVGMRYWMLNRRAKRDPEVVRDFARACRREAFFCDDDETGSRLSDFARQCDRNYEAYKNPMNTFIPLLLAALMLSGCASQTAQQKSDTQAALSSVLTGALDYSQGNTSKSAADGIQGAAYLVRALQSTPKAAQPSAVASQALLGAASPQLADTVAAATAVLVHAGKTPDVANEQVAKALDTATAK